MADGYQELTVESLGTTDGISNLCRMINELYNNMGGDGNNVRIFNGYGSPESVVTAGVGSLFLRKDGTTDTTLYRKESGTGATGWVAVANFSVPVSIANGGTGQTTAQAAIDALLPTQTGNSGKFLTTNATNASWGTVTITQKALGSWSSRSVSTTYTAATDGFVLVQPMCTGNPGDECYFSVNSTKYASSFAGGSSQYILYPISAGDQYIVTGSFPSANPYLFKPLS